MGTLYDSTTAADIPTSAPAVAGYVDGLYTWSEADWGRFPGVPHFRIAIRNTTLDADILDVENGDAIPSECPYFIRNARYKFRLPIIYCNRYTRPFVESACAGLKYDLWISTLDGIKIMQPGAVMTQWAGQAQTGQHFDLSLTDDNWIGNIQGEDMTPDEHNYLSFVAQRLGYNGAGNPPGENNLDQMHGVIVNSTQGIPAINAATQWIINDPASGIVAIKKELLNQAYNGTPADLTNVLEKLDRLIAELHTP